MKSIRMFLVTASFIFLSLFSFSSFADYIGNPSRPDTIWVPSYCKGGCVVKGHYIKVLGSTHCVHPIWVDGHYDRFGNWIGGHWRIPNKQVVNPNPDSCYVGYPM